MPTAEIIAIGTELLLGETQDTNTRYLARSLRDQRKLDSAHASATLAQLLADTSAERLRRIATMALRDKGE